MKRRQFVKGRLRNIRGFTMIEIIAALIIIAIASAVVISRGASTTDANLKSAAEVLRSHIRYVQIRAMNLKSSDTTCNAAFGISVNNPYFMFKDCNPGSKVTLPGASGDTISLPSGMTVTSATFSFDNWGRPYAVANPDPLAQTSSTIPLSLDYQGLTEPITITGNTGFVP